MKINKIEDLEFLEQYNPRLTCVNNVWGMTTDYLHAVEGRMQQVKKDLQTLLSQPLIAKLWKAQIEFRDSIKYGSVMNWRTGKLEPLTIRTRSLTDFKEKLADELIEFNFYIRLVEVLLNEDTNARKGITNLWSCANEPKGQS